MLSIREATSSMKSQKKAAQSDLMIITHNKIKRHVSVPNATSFPVVIKSHS